MGVINYKEEAKELLEGLSEDRLKVALGFLSYLRSLENREKMRTEEIYPWMRFLPYRPD